MKLAGCQDCQAVRGAVYLSRHGDDSMSQADSIIEARKARRMSQEILAQAAGVSVRTVARVEGGGRVSDESLKALCSVLGLSPAPWPEPGPAAPGGLRIVANAGEGQDRSDNLSDIEAFVRANIPEARILASTDMAAWRQANASGWIKDPRERDLRRKALFWRRVVGFTLKGFPMLYFLLAWLVLLPLLEAYYPATNPTLLLPFALLLTPTLLFTLPPAIILTRLAWREDKLLRCAYAFDDGHIHEVVLTRNLVGTVTTPLSQIRKGERRVTRHGACYRFRTQDGRRITMPFLPGDAALQDLLDPLCTSVSLLHERPWKEFATARSRLRGDIEVLPSRMTSRSYGVF